MARSAAQFIHSNLQYGWKKIAIKSVTPALARSVRTKTAIYAIMAAMGLMDISLPYPMRVWVQSQIDSGRYASVSDYGCDLIRWDRIEAEEEQRWLEALDCSIARGLGDVTAGRLHDIDDVCAELASEIRR